MATIPPHISPIARAIGLYFAAFAFLLIFAPISRADEIVPLSYSISPLSESVGNAYFLLSQEGAGPSEANLAFVNFGNIASGTALSGTINLDFTTLGLTAGVPTTYTLLATTTGPGGHTNLVTTFNSWLNQAATESSWSTMLGYYPLNFKLFINAMFSGTSVDQVAAAPAYWESQGYPQLVLPSADIFDTPSSLFPSVAWGTSAPTYDIVRYSDTGAIGQVIGTMDPSFLPTTAGAVPEPATIAILGIGFLLGTSRRPRRINR